jgi:hypothetical protein
MGRIDDRETRRRLDLVLVAADSRPRSGPGRRAARSCAVYLGHGLILLGGHFSAGAWLGRVDGEDSSDLGR